MPLSPRAGICLDCTATEWAVGTLHCALSGRATCSSAQDQYGLPALPAAQPTLC